ncbi:hypothetical protein PN473_00030, partial [Dolichospermum circinale CS-545/17]|nr:hypothetical protein [Dolichospermum circinale CS-545/17]
MKIISLRLKNNFLGWDFDEVDFSSNLTLLVGVSGAGKTQILRAILDLKSIVNGKAINGLEWKINFYTVNNTEFIWEGSFETIETDESTFYEGENEDIFYEDEDDYPSLLYEKLTSQNDVIIERSPEKIKFKNIEMPKLSSYQSIIYTLREESMIKEAYDALNKIEYRDQTRNGLNVYRISDKPLHFLTSKYKTLESIINSDENIHAKLYFVHENKLNIFNKIKSKFIEIFQQVEDIKIKLLHTHHTSTGRLFIPFIFIKENCVPQWIRDDKMSSG